MLTLSQVATASTAELLAAYNQLTGKKVARFASKTDGQKRVTKLLSKASVAAQLGPKIDAGTVASIRKAAKKAVKAPKSSGKRAPHGTVKNGVVVATGNGHTKMHAESQRHKCYDFIAKSANGISVDKLTEKMGKDARGFVLKLIEGGHVQLRS
jgi:hypothetical protein